MKTLQYLITGVAMLILSPLIVVGLILYFLCELGKNTASFFERE